MHQVGRSSARILVVEDDSSALELLVFALRGEGFEAAGASDGSSAEQLMASFHPHLAIVDLDLGDGPTGITLLRRLRAHTAIPLVFLSASGRQEDRLFAFRSGADDYVEKPFSFLELVARIRAVLRRAGGTDARVLVVGDLSLDLDGYAAARNGNPLVLTALEFALLVALMEHAGSPLSKRRLLVDVWGFSDYDENVVEVYVSSLRRKLEAFGERIIDTERGVGYVLRTSDPGAHRIPQARFSTP